MAIEKTHFTTYDLQPIADYLSANATEYFDRIEISDNKLIVTCFVGDIDVFTISRTLSSSGTNGTVTFTFKAENGYSATVATKGTDQSKSYIRRITKTSKGIAIALWADLHWSGSSRTVFEARDGIFITKDNKGNTAFVWASLIMTSIRFGVNNIYNSHEYLRCMNVKSTEYSSIAYLSSEQDFGFRPADFAQLVPVGITSQELCYLPDCYLSYYSNVIGTECTIEQNGEKYVYNGYIALKE